MIKLDWIKKTDEDHWHAEKKFEELKIKNLGEYHDWYVQKDALLLADVFENFRSKCIEIYKIDPAHFFLWLDYHCKLA